VGTPVPTPDEAVTDVVNHVCRMPVSCALDVTDAIDKLGPVEAARRLGVSGDLGDKEPAKHRSYEGLTMEQIAECWGVSRQRVDQLEKTARRKLRQKSGWVRWMTGTDA
jgi:hypothetical protein